MLPESTQEGWEHHTSHGEVVSHHGGPAICMPLYRCTQSIRLFPGPKELLVRWQSWKTLPGREAKSKPKWVNRFHQLPTTKMQAYCGFVELGPTAETWEHMGQARAQLNLSNKTQMTSHTCSLLLHKHLHMIFSDNAFNVLVADVRLPWS